MNRRHIWRNKRKTADFLWIPVFLILSFAAVKIGITGGDYIYEMDMKIVRSIDAESFKRTLSKSFPIIDAVYNSGQLSISLSGEVNNLVKRVFNFELNHPMTILNAQSALFRSYYNNNYLSYIEQQNKSGDSAPGDSAVGPETEHDPSHHGKDAEPRERVSSISIDEDSEEKNLESSDRISHGMITVMNETDYKIDIDKLLNEPLSLETGRKGPKVLIFHTHTTESYLRDIKDLDRKDVSSWNRDERYNVVRVGEELARYLRKDGIDVIHNGTVHDYPSYNGSYGRSLNTVEKILKSYPSINIVLDIHRDALGSGGKLRTASKVDGKDCAKIMFVIGTDSTSLPHPAWNENLKLALKLQSVLNEKYPGLTRHIYISSNRYNQHLSKGALIVEIGGDGDTLEEAVNSTKYLAEAINEVIN